MTKNYDSISREALLNAINSTISDTTFRGLLRKVIINAPAIEQGEVFYLVKGSYGWVITSKESYDCTDDNYKRILYTTPQQPQSVSDALEDAAKICDDEMMYGLGNKIRALIKRKEVNHG